MRNNKLAALASIALMAGMAVQASAQSGNFDLFFDENGNGLLDNGQTGNFVINNGFLVLDPTGGTLFALQYDLPSFISPGDVGFTDPDGTLSDILRFYDDANGGGHMLFYSLDNNGDLADQGAVSNFSGFIGGSEDANGNFLWAVGNNYFGNSSSRVFTPEPVTMSLGLAGIGLFVRRRKASKKA